MVEGQISLVNNFKKHLLSIRKVFTFSPIESLLLPIVRGGDATRAVNKLIPPPNLYLKGCHRKRVVRDGITYDLDRSCYTQWYLYWDLHDQTRDCLYSLVNKDDVVLDVGSNIGETLLNFAKLVGPQGYVYGFEPDQTNYQNLQANIALNSFSNVRTLNIGISDTRSTAKLFRVDDHNMGMNRILPEARQTGRQDYTTIETDTLDNTTSRLSIGKVGLIKIDVEGHEMNVLKGAQRLLSNLKPKLFVEIGHARLIRRNTSPNELLSFLENLGYATFDASKNEAISSETDLTYLGENTMDIYAVAKDS
jgi:FkbM family methyltransferase